MTTDEKWTLYGREGMSAVRIAEREAPTSYTVEKSWTKHPHTHHNFQGWAVRLTADDGSTSIVRYCKTATEAYRLVEEWSR